MHLGHNSPSPFSLSYFLLLKFDLMKTIVKRVRASTPLFFQRLRNCSLVLAALSGSLLAAPVALPSALLQAAAYLGVAASVAGAVSQTAIKGE